MFLVNQIQHVLIVGERNEFSHNAFFFVFFLFQLEHVTIELLLQGLVRVVDAKLFKAIDLEGFKAKNVEQTNARHARIVRFIGNARVDPFDDKVKRGSVHGLDKRFAGLRSIFHGQLLVDDFVARKNGAGRERVRQTSEGNPKQFGTSLRVFRIIQAARFSVAAGSKGHVAGKQHPDNELHERVNSILFEPNRRLKIIMEKVLDE
jgi:hypothetical protein